MKNFKGLQYGDYLIEGYIGKGTWRAKCQKCGLERTYKTANIKPERENGGQCPCSKSGIKIGDKFARLTVLSRDLTKETGDGIFWSCVCDCGCLTSVRTKDLKSGNTKSCGCYNIEKLSERIKKWNSDNNEDLVGQIFTKLTVTRLATEEEIERRPKGPRYWVCQCECGNIVIVNGADLRTGRVLSCGCISSWGEQQILSILQNNNIAYKKEKTFIDLISTKGGHPRFDFAIYNDNGLCCLIEYQGIQHYKDCGDFGSEQRNNTDALKQEYCKARGIHLYEVRYDEPIEQAIKAILKKEGLL